MSISNFEKDLKNEQILTQWVIDNFISVESEKYEVVEDLETQNSGVDFVMTSKDIFGFNLPYKIDFKAALNYIRPMKDEYDNKPRKMPTFAFELSFLNRENEEREGWLFGEKYNNTEYYMLAWIWVNLPVTYNKSGYIAIDIDKFNYESIREVEVMIINKEKIQSYARKHNIDQETAVEKSQEMRHNDTREVALTENSRFPKLHYSSFLQEKPVNLVIHIKDLEEMATFHKTITAASKTTIDTINLPKLNASIQESCDLINQGYLVREVMQERNLAQSTVMDHLYVGAIHGLLDPISSGLPEDKKTYIRKAVKQNGVTKLSPIKNYLDETLDIITISYDEIKRYIIEVYSNK